MPALLDSPVNARSFLQGEGEPTAQQLGAALAAALEHAETNGLGEVYAPPGEYIVRELVIPPHVRLFGDRELTVFRCEATYGLHQCKPAKVEGQPDPPEPPGGWHDNEEDKHSSVGVTLGVDTDSTGAYGHAALSDVTVIGDQTGSNPSCGAQWGLIEIHSANCRVERVTVIEPRRTGIRAYGFAANTKIIDCKVVSSFFAGIEATQNKTTANDAPGLEIRGNTVDHSAGGRLGINLSQSGNVTSQWLGARVTDNHVIGSPTTEADYICIQLFGGGTPRAVVEGNTTQGGSMGISVNRGNSVTIAGNTINQAHGRGIEVTVGRPNVGAGAGTEYVSVTGNTVNGDRGTTCTTVGIVCTTYSGYQKLRGLTIAGNSVKDCRSGISVSDGASVTVAGNHVVCFGDPSVYEQGANQDSTNSWGGITFYHGTERVLCVGNRVDGRGLSPAGIRFNNVHDVTCVGNVSRNCASQESGPPREIYLMATSPYAAALENGMRGVVSGNRGQVAFLTGSHSGAEDLRVDSNPAPVRSHAREAGNRLRLPANEAVALVGGTGSITSIASFFGGASSSFDPPTVDEARSYPGREVTLVFTSNPTVVEGSNIKIDGDLAAKAGDTLTLICDGEDWIEVNRSVN